MIDGVTGIKDLDVWSFFAEIAGVPLPPRRPRIIKDFGDPRFGKTPDSPDFIGRRVDLFLRSIPAESTSDPAGSVSSYLRNARSKAARELAKKAVVGLYPASLEAVVIWPMAYSGRVVA